MDASTERVLLIGIIGVAVLGAIYYMNKPQPQAESELSWAQAAKIVAIVASFV